MSLTKTRDVLKRIAPWALEANLEKTKYRSNYKGVRGRIGIVGGARDYAGAPYFASISAMRLGADLAYVICSSTASPVIKNYSPDLIVIPLLDCPSDQEFGREMSCLLDRMHALVVGPGLGREKLLQRRAMMLIEEAKARSLPLVMDADSLLLVNEDPSIIKSYPKVLLTPNRVELQRLLNSIFYPSTFDLRDMTTEGIRDLVKRSSSELNVTILAKGIVDIISDASSFDLTTDERLGSSRRCGGQGDILSGLAGVYLHWIEQANGRRHGDETNKGESDTIIENPTAWAGYLAAVTTRKCNELAFGEYSNGMLASNMIDKIHIVFESLLNSEHQHKGTRSTGVGPKQATQSVNQQHSKSIKNVSYIGSLTSDEIKRYARQMIMDEFGPERQVALGSSSAIIVGAGGLGCPAAVYLGAAGIGRLGVVDDDKVEVSNLHRQILHNLSKVGMLKTESIKEAILAINPNVKVETHSVRMSRENAVSLIESYDIVIDATDNILARYMISDACVVAKKPLISGAALKMDGQLTVYNYDQDTPCFRCLFPEPPPANAVGSCSDNGVLGIIPGIIGVQQALEAIKMGAGLKPAYAGKMLLFDGQLGLFRHITLGKRKLNCRACGSNAVLGRELIDYDEFCRQSIDACDTEVRKAGGTINDILQQDERVTVEQYRDILESNETHVLVDVRPLNNSSVSRFAHALTIPVAKLMNDDRGEIEPLLRKELNSKNTKQIYVVCRRGIASQRGTRLIQELLKSKDNETSFKDVVVKDIVGGMTAWEQRIDSDYSCL